MASQEHSDQLDEKQHPVLATAPEEITSNTSSHDNVHLAQQHGIKDDIEAAQRTETKDKRTRISLDLRRTASNVLTHAASHLTTRSWPEPPPPPDGGTTAWVQVASMQISGYSKDDFTN